jgi:SAM-dependent methyltransferase
MMSFGDNQAAKAKRDRIIEYWNEALLCSPVSSTSHADPDLAFLDNAIENQILGQLLNAWAVDYDNCMDVGAGYGRFADLFRRFYSHVVLLEPAERIYEELIGFWGQDPQIECHNRDFESYVDSCGFDLIFTSGVLYLYDDKMVKAFLRKAISMLNEDGILLIRDFLSVPDREVVESKYVENGFCYYRPIQFWNTLANQLGIEMIGARRSKPSLAWLRNRYILLILKTLGLKGICRCQIVIDTAMRFGNFRIQPGDIQSVFIGMRLL